MVTFIPTHPLGHTRRRLSEFKMVSNSKLYQGRCHFPRKVWSSYAHFMIYQSKHYRARQMVFLIISLIVEFRMVIMCFSTRGPISFRYMVLWCMFLSQTYVGPKINHALCPCYIWVSLHPERERERELLELALMLKL